MNREGQTPSPLPPPAMSPAGPPDGRRQARTPIRVPILALILVVATSAMAFTALRTASKPWHEATYTFTVFMLLTAVLASRFRRGSERACWFGFAVFGWAFFLLGYRPWMNAFDDLADDGGPPFNPLLLTSRVLAFFLPHLRKPTNNLGAIDEITQVTLGIAHLLMTLVVGLIGGVIAVLLRRRPRSRVSTRSLSIVVGLALAASVALSNVPDGSPTPFFPRGADRWYSKHLAAMGEPSLLLLSQKDRKVTVYRLLWLPTFDHPVCVRITRSGDGAYLRAVVLDGRGGYHPGQVAIDRSLFLRGTQWDELEGLIVENAFWELPTRIDGDSGCDGDQLIVEGVSGGKYHVVDRWNPDLVYKALCRYMLKLTTLEVSAQWEEYHSGPSSDDPE